MSFHVDVEDLAIVGEQGHIRFDAFSVALNRTNPCCVVIGPSGSGKTTFFRSLLIRFRNEWKERDHLDCDIQCKLNDRTLHDTGGTIGYAAQQPYFVAHRTVKQNLLLPFKWKDRNRPSNKKVNKVLRDFRLDEVVDRQAFRLSSGERQRLNLARSFLLDPAVLVIDECLSSIDEGTAQEINDVIVDEYLPKTFLFVCSHRPSDRQPYMGGRVARFDYEVNDARTRQVSNRETRNIDQIREITVNVS